MEDSQPPATIAPSHVATAGSPVFDVARPRPKFIKAGPAVNDHEFVFCEQAWTGLTADARKAPTYTKYKAANH